MLCQAGDKKKWRAMIQYNHEQHHVGYYPTAEEAARAYDRKALLFMGPSAITNFPPSDYAGEDLTAEGTAEEQVPHLTPTLLPFCVVSAIRKFGPPNQQDRTAHWDIQVLSLSISERL